MAADELRDLRPLPPEPTLTLIRALSTDRRARDARGVFFVEGVRNFVTALDHGMDVETLLYSERLLTSPLARKLVRRLKRAGVPFARVTPEQFRAVSRAAQASGVGAILRQHTVTLNDVRPDDPRCWVALRHVRSPGNLGTLIRTCAAVGAAGVITVGPQVDPFDPAVVRASMGALAATPIVRASLGELRDWAQRHRVPVFGASPDGDALYSEVRYPLPAVLLLGEERGGLTAEERAACDRLVRIPMAPGTDSLNLGVAGSLLLYEVLRSAGGG